MKKILLFLVACVMVLSACSANGYGRKDVSITLQEIHNDAAFKQFKKATKMNQLEILTSLIREANSEYLKIESIDAMYDLREDVVKIKRYLASGKQAFGPIQKDYNILYNKITKTIREYEKGTTMYVEEGGYYDFGQELD